MTASTSQPEAVDHQGLVNKFPFDSAKKTYPYWDGTLGEAVDVKYKETVEVKGTKAYVYEVNTRGASIDIAKGVKGTYDDVTTIYVEPRTGAILNQTDNQQRYLENGDKVLDLQLAFTDAQQQKSVDDLSSDLRLLSLVETIVPLVGIIGGVICLGAAIVLLLLARRQGSGQRSSEAPRTTGASLTRLGILSSDELEVVLVLTDVVIRVVGQGREDSKHRVERVLELGSPDHRRNVGTDVGLFEAHLSARGRRPRCRPTIRAGTPGLCALAMSVRAPDVLRRDAEDGEEPSRPEGWSSANLSAANEPRKPVATLVLIKRGPSQLTHECLCSRRCGPGSSRPV